MEEERKEHLGQVNKTRAEKIKLLRAYYKIDYTTAQARYYELEKEGKLEQILKEAQSGPILCPQCGSDMIERNGRNGPFLSCTRFPDCRGVRDVKQANKPVDPKKIENARKYIENAYKYIEQVGGIVNARLYLNIACKSIEEMANDKLDDGA